MQLVLSNTAVSKKAVRHFFAAAAFFAQDERLAQQLCERDFLLLLVAQKMLVDRGDEHHTVFTEGLAAEVAVLAAHADEAEIEQSVLEAADDALAVALLNNKINIRMQSAEVGQKLWQDIGRRDGGGTEVNDALAFDGAGLQHALLELENILGIFIELASLGRDLQAFGCAQNKLGVERSFQLADVRADGGLRDKKLAGGLREAFLLYDGDEALQLFKVHG